MKKMLLRTFLLLSCAGSVLFIDSAQADEEKNPTVFIRPAILEPAVLFWRRIYTEVTTKQGLIHDNERLDIIYQAINLDVTVSRRERSATIERIKDRYRDALLKLARGERNDLTPEERRVLALWGESTSEDEFKAAAGRIRFQLGQADKFRDGLVRSGRWMPFIRKTLKDANMPLEIAALPHVESSFNPSAYSSVGAAGMWQFTRSTGERYMRVDHVVDERLDPYVATVAASRLLQYNYNNIKSWPLAITAYNHGLAGVTRAARETGTTDIETIIKQYKGRAFGFASRNFYTAFLAAVEVNSNPKRFLGDIELEPVEQSTALALPYYVPSSQLAQVFALSREELRGWNPALRPPVWEGSKHVPKGYSLRLPAKQYPAAPMTLLMAMQERHAQQKPDLTYRVRRGDSLSAIADRFNVSPRTLMALNNLNNQHLVREGQLLRLPAASNAPAAVIATTSATSVSDVASVNTTNAPVITQPLVKSDGLYTVQPGDAISTIAARFGVSQTNLMLWNNLSQPRALLAGQVLRLQAPITDVNVLAGSTAKSRESNRDNKVPKGAVSTVLAGTQAELRVPTEDKVETAEPVTAQEAELIAPVQPAGLHPGLSADPSDYTVASDGTIRMQAVETLGHYAEWLDIPTQQLRDVNRWSRNSTVKLYAKVKLDFSKVDKNTFEARRAAYHQQLQGEYFNRYQIEGSKNHVLRKGESVWWLANNRYHVPVWLLLQYNPGMRLDKVKAGDAVVFPIVQLKAESTTP